MASASASVLPAGAAPAALYQQVKDFVLRRIDEAALRPGDRLPSEQELVVALGVARMTVNRALRELAAQGRIVRVAGVGSFVAEPKPQSTLLRIASIADEIRGRGHVHHCDLVSQQRVSATMEVAAALELQPGSSVFHVVCVHHEEGVPVQVEDRYVSPRAAPDFLQQDFRNVLPGEWLLRHVPVEQIEHVVDAIEPPPQVAELLKMQPVQPCLLLTRRTWGRDGPVTLVRCFHPGQRYRLGGRFRAEGGEQAAT